MASLFRFSNFLVLPLWALMILLPRWRWTTRIMRSPFVSALPATLYAALVLPQLGEVWPIVSRPALSSVAVLLGSPAGATIAWCTFSRLIFSSGAGFISKAMNGRSIPGSWRRCCFSR